MIRDSFLLSGTSIVISLRDLCHNPIGQWCWWRLVFCDNHARECPANLSDTETDTSEDDVDDDKKQLLLATILKKFHVINQLFVSFGQFLTSSKTI